MEWIVLYSRPPLRTQSGKGDTAYSYNYYPSPKGSPGLPRPREWGLESPSRPSPAVSVLLLLSVLPRLLPLLSVLEQKERESVLPSYSRQLTIPAWSRVLLRRRCVRALRSPRSSASATETSENSEDHPCSTSSSAHSPFNSSAPPIRRSAWWLVSLSPLAHPSTRALSRVPPVSPSPLEALALL